MENDNNKKDNYLLDEIISPIFGHDYQNRVVENKNLVPNPSHPHVSDASNTSNVNYEAHVSKKSQEPDKATETNYLEKQIEEELEAKNKIAKVKEYQEGFKTDTDVLKQYQKEKEARELHASLPSNYLNFRDSLEKVTDDLSIISDFTSNFMSVSLSTATTELENTSISEIVDDIFPDIIN